MSRCKDCDVDLVAPQDLEDAAAEHVANPREALADVEKANIPVRTLDGARELEAELNNAGIVCYVHAEETEGAMMSAGSINYLVAVARDDIEKIQSLLDGRYKDMLEREGVAGLVDQVVDLEAEEVTCPACGHAGPLDDEGACADCGLVLGVG
jgi:hypothetical protein